MKERPIIFSAPMVRAILAGEKTQTRRVMKLDAPYHGADWVFRDGTWTPCADELCRGTMDAIGRSIRCPYGVSAGRLWVRETFGLSDGVCFHDGPPRLAGEEYEPIYAADGEAGVRWFPSIYMPRWASRITLEIIDVRVQALQAISDEDARAEGVSGADPIGEMIELEAGSTTSIPTGARFNFAVAWDDINSKRAPWSANPWVWAITFKRVESRATRGAA